MRDQISPTPVVVVTEPIVQEEQISKKIVQSRDSNNIESDEDSGFHNESNVSLNTIDIDTNKINVEDINTVDQEELECQKRSEWRLNIYPKVEDITDENIVLFMKMASEEFDNVPEEYQRQWMLERLKETFENILPQSLIEVSAARMFDGDSGVSMDTRPPWLDMDKFRRGQKFAKDYLYGIMYAEMTSLLTVFSFDLGLKPIIATSESSTPYTAFKRYLSTSNRVRNWYLYDPWTAGTPAYNDIRTVRRMHERVRKTVSRMSREQYAKCTKIENPWCPTLEIARRDFLSTCPAPARGQCPYMVFNKFPDLPFKELNQGEMALTQFAFLGLVILAPEYFGIHYATDEDLDAFCHVWRGLGYLLGIEDEYNFCRGTLEDIKIRSTDFLEYWVKPNFRVITPEWEHMMRCVVEGIQYYFPGTTYETCLLDLAEVMNLHMPRLYSTLSYTAWIKRGIAKFYFHHLTKLAMFRTLMNFRLQRALKRGQEYDEKKLKQLEERSAKTLNAYTMEVQKKKESIQESVQSN